MRVSPVDAKQSMFLSCLRADSAAHEDTSCRISLTQAMSELGTFYPYSWTERHAVCEVHADTYTHTVRIFAAAGSNTKDNRDTLRRQT